MVMVDAIRNFFLWLIGGRVEDVPVDPWDGSYGYYVAELRIYNVGSIDCGIDPAATKISTLRASSVTARFNREVAAAELVDQGVGVIARISASGEGGCLEKVHVKYLPTFSLVQRAALKKSLPGNFKIYEEEEVEIFR